MSSNPLCNIDPYQFLELKQNPDGSITRLTETPSTLASSDPNTPSSVVTKDFPLNLNHKTFLRLFLPKLALNSSYSSQLPIIVYFHGGGFVFHHADSTIFHDFCTKTAVSMEAVVASVEYRLAPEHRLPAAYEDALEAIKWVHDSLDQDNWLSKYGDFSKCFLMGSSAGGNIAYHVGLRALTMVDELDPLKVKGLILHQPFFGGSGRTESELRLVNDPYVPLSASDLFWALGLPLGVDRDHEYSNLTAGSGPGLLGRAKELGWRVLVTGCYGDPLVDRGVEVVKLLEEKGVTVMGHFIEGGYHAIEIFDSVKCSSFLGVVKDFVNSCQNNYRV